MEFKLETLTHDQQFIFDLVESTDDNILIHGKPGTGKSVLIRALRETGRKHYTVGAPTGLAAINIGMGAKTLHSLFMIPVSNGIFTPDFNKFTNNPNVRNNILHSIKHLIIDEISMVRADTLDYIDRVLRNVKDVDKPFGGIQVIAVGDFFQLPPVINSKDKKDLLGHGYRSEFAFDARCFQDFTPVILEEVLRQKGDNSFIDILHAARTGNVTADHLAKLNRRVEPCTDFRVRLASKNVTADEINQKHLREIKATAVEYHANAVGSWPQFPAETVLQLKPGAQVLVKKNAADRPPGKSGPHSSVVVNGSLAIVRELPPATDDEPQRVVVEMADGSMTPIYIVRWEQKAKEKIGDRWEERVIASFEQMPLQLAWAISMHKSQGQSFDAVHIDPQSIFAAGQLYVALSRARSLAGLSLESKVNSKLFWANKRVLAYVADIEKQSKKLKQVA